eukprot:GHVU01228998.1.p3 GENE.GHVU01228998.1~~GHVU01228998.1.p3  ORF type:complete len:106 (+),score=28.91 GHVU01228998.1:692-1009(+)
MRAAAAAAAAVGTPAAAALCAAIVDHWSNAAAAAAVAADVAAVEEGSLLLDPILLDDSLRVIQVTRGQCSEREPVYGWQPDLADAVQLRLEVSKAIRRRGAETRR